MDNNYLKTAQQREKPPGDLTLGMYQYRLEPDGRLIFTSANPGADLILGIEHAPLIGKPIEKIFPGLSDTQIPDIYRNVARDGTPWHTDQLCIEHGQITYAFQIHAFQTSPGVVTIIFQDIRARQELERSLTKRDAILSAVAFAAEQFLSRGDWQEKIQPVLSRLGMATEASRFYLCENRLNRNGHIQVNRLFEWESHQSGCRPWLINFDYEAQKFTRWVDSLSSGEAIHGLVSDFPEHEKKLLSVHQIKSIAVAPVHVNRKWWGTIGFDDCKDGRLLSTSEIDALKTAASTIGAAIQQAESEEKNNHHVSRAQTMVKTGARLSAGLNLPNVASTVCSEITASLKAGAASVYLYNEQTQMLDCTGGFNLPDDCLNSPAIPLATLNLYLHKWGIPLYLQDKQDIKRFFNVPLDQMMNIKSIVTWLLLYDQKLIGVVNIFFNTASRTLEPDEFELLEGLGNQAALAFNNARLYELERKRTQEITSLYDLSVRLNGAQSTQETLKSTLSNVQDLLEADAGLVMLPDERKSLLSIPQANGYLEKNQGRVTALDETWFDSILDHSVPYPSQGLFNEDPLFSSLEGIERAGPAVMVPLLSAHKPTGLLMVTRQKDLLAQPFSSIDLRLLRTIGELAGTAVQKNRFYEDAQRRLTFLQSLRAIDTEITSSLDLESTLQVVIDEVISQLHADAVDIMIIQPETHSLAVRVARGFQNADLLKRLLSYGNHYAKLAAIEKRMVILPDINHEPTQFVNSELFSREGFTAYVAVPLFSKGKVKGVMEVYRRQPLELDQEWLEFLETLSGQAAIAIENITLFNHLQQSNIELMQAYDTTIEGWSNALDLKDADTEGHTQRVTQLAIDLAHEIGLEADELVHVRRGAMLHDIGKMGVPDQILRKPGPLDDEEWKIMKLHPVYAYQWLSPTEYLHPALDIPYCHHEKWDGTGYPQGLQGDEIPIKARIFSVIDVWDALSSDRPYRSKWPQEKIISYIREQTGTHFDPQIVPVFLDLINNQEYVM